MKKDLSMIIVVAIIAVFLIFTIIYFFNTSDIRDNTSASNIDNSTVEENNNSIQIYEETSPKLKTEFMEIATYTTNIYDKDDNRIHNIKLACSSLNGHVVASGEEFSFNNTMGNMGKEDGYKKALGFDSEGNKIKVYGGGICQISSTLYNALLIAKLEVTERHAHSRRVYYVPKDKDATVFSGGPDLKFINNTDNDITIYASTDGYTVTISLKQKK